MSWTDEEKAIMADNWGKGLSQQEWAELIPGKTFGALQAYALRNKMGGNRFAFWTPEEDAILKTYWSTRKPMDEWMHLLPGRTRRGTYAHAKIIELGPRPRPYISTLWNDVVTLLADRKPRSIQQISDETGWSDRWIRSQIRRRIGEEIYIAKWIPKAKNGTQPTAMFLIGNEKNADKPKPLPRDVIQKRYMDRMKKKSPIDYQKKIARETLKRRVRNGKPIVTQADPAAAWMFNALPKAA